ncbi:MAG TPA: N-6 DNA methylase, partial [Chitinophagaceae bacterium]
MITKANFKNLLVALSFKEKDAVFSKKINGILIQADFKEEKLLYQKGVKIEGDFTTNFSSNENFVVFECVHRLLELGYKQDQLTLEPKWKLGHGASGGRADIVIKDNEGKIFTIIECKTAGKEFNDTWDVGLQYPSQLFSYAQQEGSTQLLCLYTSDFIEGKPERQYFIITLSDNEELLQTLEDSEVLTYRTAQRFDEKFNVWKDTYLNEAYTIGFFEDDIQPFHFGRKNYSINDLKEISHNDIQKKYHQFATILRKYNVSGRENAFDKLVNLFLCKVVDEQQNPTNLKFSWKGRAYDSDFELQDRLQRLYQKGMRQFLNEEVTYINKEQIDEAFRFFEKDNDPDATKATIHKYFIQLKFFTNNDFAFIDVHNERLFRENAVVLRSIVEMLQDIKLKSENSDNQFLGDMFEGFLDSGVKQSEGQFFTPMPIVKFIINSLPLENIIISNDQPPKAIDYACGAGHFLTELARQIKPIVEEYKKVDISEYYSNISGIEKEYRLSKVAKVSAFMYGQDEIQIIYADALARNELIQNGSYNILVANPPYSVKGFLETLTHPERKAFELLGSIDDKGILTNNSIETFFIERAKQLLAPDGVAAIILPSSVLSNDANQYRQTREILLQYFHIIAIAELGSGTFGKTGTNTVTLFLRRRKINPSEAEHYKYRVQCWIGGDVSPRTKKNKQYNDLHLLEAYCRHIKIPFEDYKYFLTAGKPNEALEQTEIWKEYEKAFYESTEIKNHQKKPYFKSLSEERKKEDLNELLFRRIRHQEDEKLYYFLLAQSNIVPVLVIKSPSENKAIKKFLGYEWSSAKGSEGIKYVNSKPIALDEGEPVLITAQLNAIQTPLYNAAKKDDAEKLNYYINKNFVGESFTLPDELSQFAHTVHLADMLDFNRKDFSKVISLSVKKVVEVNSKWKMEKLENLKVLLQRGKSTSYGDSNIQVIKSGQARGGRSFDFSKPEYAVKSFKGDERNLKKGDILINSTGIGTAGRVTYFDLTGNFVADNHITILRSNGKVNSEYVLYYFENYIGFKTLESMAQGISGQVELSLS